MARGALPRSDRVQVEDQYVAPRNRLEEAVHAAWVETLRLPEPVSIHSNFFEVNGSIILAREFVLAELKVGQTEGCRYK